MDAIRIILSALLILHGEIKPLQAAAILNCTGVDIRVTSHSSTSAPGSREASPAFGETRYHVTLGPNMTLKIYEAALYDVLRISVHDLTDDAIYGVMLTIDGHWTVRRRDAC